VKDGMDNVPKDKYNVLLVTSTLKLLIVFSGILLFSDHTGGGCAFGHVSTRHADQGHYYENYEANMVGMKC
jgi:hypothetical protein